MPLFKVVYERLLHSNNSQGENHPLWGGVSPTNFMIAKADDMKTAKVETEKELLQLKDSDDFHLTIFNFAEELQNTSVSKSTTSEVA